MGGAKIYKQPRIPGYNRGSTFHVNNWKRTFWTGNEKVRESHVISHDGKYADTKNPKGAAVKFVFGIPANRPDLLEKLRYDKTGEIEEHMGKRVMPTMNTEGIIPHERSHKSGVHLIIVTDKDVHISKHPLVGDHLVEKPKPRQGTTRTWKELHPGLELEKIASNLWVPVRKTG